MPRAQTPASSDNTSTPTAGSSTDGKGSVADPSASDAGQAGDATATAGGGAAKAEPSEDEKAGLATLADAEKVAEDLRKAAEDPKLTGKAKEDALAKADQAEKISQAIASLVTPSEKLSDEELIAIAKREKRMQAGLGVVAAVTGALYALWQVLTDVTFQKLLNEDLPAPVRSAMTKALDTVLQKLGPMFSAFRKLQEPALREKTNNLFDAGVNIAYALVELSDEEAQEGARKNADNIALTMGLVKQGGPLVLACIDLIKCCLSALGDNKAANLDPQTAEIGQKLDKALRARTAQRALDYQKNVEAGALLLEAQKHKLLSAAP